MAKCTSIRDRISTIHDYCIDIDNREIFLTSIDDSCEIDCVMAGMFLKNIRLLQSMSHEQIIIHIGISGGDWNYGMMIYDIISKSPCPITTISYGSASSMASIIPQAADVRVITPHTDFMIHEGYITYDGTTKGAKQNVNWNDHLTKIMLDVYVKNCKNGNYFTNWTEVKISKYLKDKLDKNEDWFMTAEDAINYGFMDGILGDKNYMY